MPSATDPQQPAPADDPASTGTAGTPGEPAVPAPEELPTEDELEREAVPATVRRAPRYGAFITAGALLGLVVGLVLAIALQPAVPVVSDAGFISFLGGHGTVRTVCAVAGAVFGGFLGGGLAVLADRRSRAR